MGALKYIQTQGTQTELCNNLEGWNGRETGGRLEGGDTPMADSC